jgi:hypothetical protein
MKESFDHDYFKLKIAGILSLLVLVPMFALGVVFIGASLLTSYYLFFSHSVPSQSVLPFIMSVVNYQTAESANDNSLRFSTWQAVISNPWSKAGGGLVIIIVLAFGVMLIWLSRMCIRSVLKENF